MTLAGSVRYLAMESADQVVLFGEFSDSPALSARAIERQLNVRPGAIRVQP